MTTKYRINFSGRGAFVSEMYELYEPFYILTARSSECRLQLKGTAGMFLIIYKELRLVCVLFMAWVLLFCCRLLFRPISEALYATAPNDTINVCDVMRPGTHM